MMMRTRTFQSRRRARSAAGQSTIEMAMMLPVLVAVVLGLVELSYALLDQHVATKAAREGANLISRDATLDDAYSALQSMATGPINFSSRTKVIFTVVWQPTSGSNSGQNVVYQRLIAGASVGGGSAITCGCSAGAFTGPDHAAVNADSDTSLRVTGGVPANSLGPGGYLYIAEIFANHTLITPLNRFGITVPSNLYTIAYF